MLTRRVARVLSCVQELEGREHSALSARRQGSERWTQGLHQMLQVYKVVSNSIGI